MKTLTCMHRCAPRMCVPKLWIWTSKIMPDLWLLDLFCPIKKKNHTPPYWMCSTRSNDASLHIHVHASTCQLSFFIVCSLWGHQCWGSTTIKQFLYHKVAQAHSPQIMRKVSWPPEPRRCANSHKTGKAAAITMHSLLLFKIFFKMILPFSSH